MAKMKKNPQDTKDLIDALRKGELDGRCSVAKQIINTRQAISEKPEDCIKAILINSISINCQIQDKILKEMHTKDLITDDGRVDKLVTQDLLNIQRALISNCGLLGQIEGILVNQKHKKRDDKLKKAKRNKLVSDLILEVNSGIESDIDDDIDNNDGDSDVDTD